MVGAALQTGGLVDGSDSLLHAAAESLGSLPRLRSVRNLTLYGRGRYADISGGSCWSTSDVAPVQSIEVDDLRRAYDLERESYAQFEYSSPQASADPIGPDTATSRTILQKSRAAPLCDGSHMRRLWMLNNPVVLVRAAMDPRTTILAVGRGGDCSEISMQLAPGDRLSAGFSSATAMPQWVRWSNPHPNLGQVTFTTHLMGYVDFEGLMLPTRYVTRLDWRYINYLQIDVDRYHVNQAIADLPAGQAAPGSASIQPDSVRASPVAEHLWLITPGDTAVIEFWDHLTLCGLYEGGAIAQQMIECAQTLVPGKPVTELIVLHHDFAHTAGLRQAVAQDLTIISRCDNESIFSEMVLHPAFEFPDELARSRKPLRFLGVKERLRLKDELMSVELLPSRGGQLMLHAPGQKMMLCGPGPFRPYQHLPLELLDAGANVDEDESRPSRVQALAGGKWGARPIPDPASRASARCRIELRKRRVPTNFRAPMREQS